MLKYSSQINLKGNKDLTLNTDPIELTDFEYVYIPLLNMGVTDFEILVKENEKVKVGQKIALSKGHFYLPIYSSVSGTVEKIEKMMSASLVYAQHIVIKNDNQFDRYEDIKKVDLNTATKDDIVDVIKESGLVGRGGSGFPTYVKYTSPAKIDTVLINGVECEPYITIDYVLMKKYSDQLIEGTRCLIKASGASKAIIAFKVGKEELKNLLIEKTKDYPEIEIVEVPDVYPMGWERTLIKEIFNKTYDKLPSEIGLIVNNSTTAISVARAMKGELKYNKGVTLSGDGLASPRNVYVPIGAKVSDIVEKIGGYSDTINLDTKLIMGGPMMGKAVVSDEVAISTYTNAVNVLTQPTLRELPCLRCSRCLEYCPSGLQPCAIKDAERAQNDSILIKLSAQTCVECGLCSYICPSNIQVTDWTSKGKKRALSALKKQEEK